MEVEWKMLGLSSINMAKKDDHVVDDSIKKDMQKIAGKNDMAMVNRILKEGALYRQPLLSEIISINTLTDPLIHKLHD